MDGVELLNDEQHKLLTRFLMRAASVETREDFDALVANELKHLFKFEILICGLGYITEQDSIQTIRLLNYGFPVEYLRSIQTQDGGIVSPVMLRWIETLMPQMYDPEDGVNVNLPKDWRSRYEEFGLRNLIAHGLLDPHARTTSYFNFCNVERPLLPYHDVLLRIATPSLHGALMRLIKEMPPLGVETAAAAPALTTRELELLKAVSQGHNHKLIADMLDISEHTVRNHLRNIYAKLGAKKATQAMEIAKRLRLV